MLSEDKVYKRAQRTIPQMIVYVETISKTSFQLFAIESEAVKVQRRSSDVHSFRPEGGVNSPVTERFSAEVSGAPVHDQTPMVPSVDSVEMEEQTKVNRTPALKLDSEKVLEQVRKNVREEIAAQRVPYAELWMPRKISSLDRETELYKAIGRAERKDCRTAYAGAGLLAIPILIADAFREEGCKW